MKRIVAITVASWLFWCGAASALAQAQDQPAQQTTEQQPSPTEPAANPQPSTSPAQDCAKTKDTCELPPEPAVPPTQPSATPAPTEKTEQTKPAAAAKPGKPKKKSRSKKHAAHSSGPHKVVVRDGGTSEPNSQLSVGGAGQQASTARQSTDELLASTQANLKTVSARTLNANQQATVEQIKMFMEQANAALNDGDIRRGHNLAMKAHLLSDDLMKH